MMNSLHRMQLITCMMLALAACGSGWCEPLAAQQLWTKFQEAKANGQRGEMVKIIGTIDKEHPMSEECARGLIELHNIHWTQQNSSLAEEVLSKVLERWPKTMWVWTIAGNHTYMLRRQDAGKALAFLETITRHDAFPPDKVKDIPIIRMPLLAHADPQRFLTEVQPELQKLSAATTAQDVARIAKLAALAYQPLMKTGKAQEARALSEDIQNRLARAGNPEGLLQLDSTAYLQALRGNDAKAFVVEARPIVRTLQWAQNPNDAKLPLQVATWLYQDLLKAGRVDEARAIHREVQAAGQGQPDARAWLATDASAYYYELSLVDTAAFLEEVTATVPTLTELPDLTTAQARVRIAGLAYPAFMGSGKLEEAKQLHDRMQAALKKLPKATSLIESDQAVYQKSLSQGAIAGMFWLFKKAAAGGDLATAKKWLTVLNTVAAEHPHAIEARKIYQELEKQQPR